MNPTANFPALLLLFEEVVMLSRPTDLAAYRADKYYQLAKERISQCSDDGFVLFATAYVAHHGMLDRYEVQCNLERYQRVHEVPRYLVIYLRGLQ